MKKTRRGHPIILSFEPGEDWFYDYEKRGMIKGCGVASATFASGGSTINWPAGRVPANWELLLPS